MEIEPDRFGRIGVLMGGPSSEREISLSSGKAVCLALQEKALDALAIDVQNDDLEYNRRLIKQANIDIVFIALHGCFGEDGQIQALLEEMNLAYTGSDSSASQLAMDKIDSRRIFQKGQLPVPGYTTVSLKDSQGDIGRIIRDLLPPFVVKPARQGSSIGLSIVQAQEELKPAMEYAFGFGEQVIIEEYIAGREITAGILGDTALPVVEVMPQNKFYDYEAKYKPGKSNYIVPADLPPQVSVRVQQTALRAHRLLGCFGFSRVDMRLSPDNTPFILEVNSIPGLTATSLLPKAAKAAGIDFAQLCVSILRLAYQRWIKRQDEKDKVKVSG